LPHDSKREDFAIVVEETFKVFVRTTTLKEDFDIVLEFGCIWGILFHNHECASVYEWVGRIVFLVTNFDAFVCVERTSELIAVDNAENTSVKLNVYSNVEVLPGIGLNTAWLGDEVTLEENALGNTRVLNARLNDVQGAVL